MGGVQFDNSPPCYSFPGNITKNIPFQQYLNPLSSQNRHFWLYNYWHFVIIIIIIIIYYYYHYYYYYHHHHHHHHHYYQRYEGNPYFATKFNLNRKTADYSAYKPNMGNLDRHNWKNLYEHGKLFTLSFCRSYTNIFVIFCTLSILQWRAKVCITLANEKYSILKNKQVE